jgi:hypothetical protein
MRDSIPGTTPSATHKKRVRSGIPLYLTDKFSVYKTLRFVRWHTTRIDKVGGVCAQRECSKLDINYDVVIVGIEFGSWYILLYVRDRVILYQIAKIVATDEQINNTLGVRPRALDWSRMNDRGAFEHELVSTRYALSGD